MKIKKERMPFNSVLTKDKYNINNEDVVVIEKSNTFKFIINILIAIGKIIIYTILLTLAFIGLISIIIPETRDILIVQTDSVINEFLKMIGG